MSFNFLSGFLALQYSKTKLNLGTKENAPLLQVLLLARNPFGNLAIKPWHSGTARSFPLLYLGEESLSRIIRKIKNHSSRHGSYLFCLLIIATSWKLAGAGALPQNFQPQDYCEYNLSYTTRIFQCTVQWHGCLFSKI